MLVDAHQNATPQTIIDLISWSLNIPTNRIYPHSSLVDDLYLDAVDKMLLIVELENRLQVYLTPEQAAAIETVQDASNYFTRGVA